MKAFPYQKNKVHIRWFQDDIQYTKDVLTLRKEVESDTPVTVVLELRDSGKMVAYAR